jgi:hypothetical protein
MPVAPCQRLMTEHHGALALRRSHPRRSIARLGNLDPWCHFLQATRRFRDPSSVASVQMKKRPGPHYAIGAQPTTRDLARSGTRRKNMMLSNRTLRRTAGFISRFFADQLFAKISDPRSKRGRRWKSAVPLLKAVAVGLAAGCKGFLHVERLTKAMPPEVRRLLGIHRFTPDTTLRDFVCALNPDELCRVIWVVGYDALRRGALLSTGQFPFGMVSMDGKYPSVRDVGDNDNKPTSRYLQVHHDQETAAPLHGLVRVITSVLITAVGRPIIAASPVPAQTNEVGHFRQAFGDLVRMYGRRFRVVLYDAGAASLPNAKAVVAAGKHYFFQIADPRWIMYQTIELLLSETAPATRTEEISGNRRVVRELTLKAVTETAKSLTLWRHTRTIIKVYSQTYENAVLTGTKTRYFVTSLDPDELSPEKWLQLVVARWGVETAHQILDCAFEEDKHPWVTKDANGALVMMLLRRLVYTMMTLYKSVTIRSEETRQTMTWRELMAEIRNTLEWARQSALEGLRQRVFAIPPALA